MSKPSIKIFVSHRIDQLSETISNPLYTNVRCGAVFDKRDAADYASMLGDNTGDNISQKRMSFCELTVHYWAWKNQELDYYGLCHYRRYLSFSDEQFTFEHSEHDNGCVKELFLDDEVIKKHCLSEEKMTESICKYDLICGIPINLGSRTNYEAMKESPDYHNMDDVDFAIDYIKQKYPQMIKAVDEYMFRVHHSWLYNCWIMKKELFSKYSEWLFDVLFAVEKHINNCHYSETMFRTPGVIGERLFGIFVTYIQTNPNYRIKKTPLIFIANTNRQLLPKPAFNTNNIAIASNFNNNYIPIFSVLLQSIISSSNAQNNYDFILLGSDYSEENKTQLLRMIKSISNFSIRFFDPLKYVGKLHPYVNNAVYTTDMYVRVLIPYIMENYEKVLVLDADMIAVNDVATLYAEDLEDNYIGAVNDIVYEGYLNGMQPGTYEYTHDTLKLSDPYKYCNTGVLLLNCQKIKDRYTLEYLQNYIETHSFRIYEQDMINALFSPYIKMLDRRWNLFAYTNDYIEKCVKCAPMKDSKQYAEARKNPYIIHYAAHPKPWWTGSGDFSFEFWRHARMTPYYEQIITIMINQIALSHSSGTIEKIIQVPSQQEALRWRIVNTLFPKGSHRREFMKLLLPKNSWRRNTLRKIYYRIMHID